MKYSGKCPKCNSSEIVKFNQYWGDGSSYNQGVHVRTGFFRGADLRLYVCSNCGYCESWIDKEDLSEIKNNQR